MVSAKDAALGFLNSKVFWNKAYDVKIIVHDVTGKILSGDSNYIVDVVMWLNFGNSNISMRSYHNNFIRSWSQKTRFLRGALGSSSIIWVSHWVWPWNFTPMCQKV